MDMTDDKNYILWLPSWYPTEISPYDGDFIQRHAKAVSLFTPIHVFHIKRDKKRLMTNSVRYVEKVQGNLSETIVYYASPDIPVRFADRLLSQIRYGWLYRRHIRKLFRQKGFPQLVHAHIIYKAGLIAKWIDKKFGIPFFLTEQWTIHLPEAKPNLSDIAFSEQHIFSRIMDHVLLVLPVSEYLGEAIQKHWPNIRYEVVPNVVDRNIFFPAEKKPSEILRLVHISTLTYQKDPESLVKALALVKSQGLRFQLDVYGPKLTTFTEMVHQSGLEEEIILHGEVPQQALAACLQQSDVLILYSRFETFGCVIIEANACGVPVLVPDTPLMQELVKEGENGILVPPGNYKALAEAIVKFSTTKDKFNSRAIAESTASYRYENVGKQIADLYQKHLPVN